MAKSSNNLKAVLQDTANAIRTKKGSADLIEPRDFADTISSLPDQEAVQKLYSGTTVNAVVPDGVSSLQQYLFYQNTVLESIDFNGATIIPQYFCSGCSALTSVKFNSSTTRINDRAFYGCTKIDNLSLPHTIDYVGQYAFYQVGSYYTYGTHTFEFTLNSGVRVWLDTSAFNTSHISKFDGVIRNCGSEAFSYCTSLEYVNAKFDGCAIGNDAFTNCSYITYFNIDATSRITNLGSGVFSSLASQTYQSANISPFDFRNSTFIELKSYVWGNCRFDGIVYFPSTLSSITGNFLNSATGNWTLYFLSVPSVSNSNYLRVDTTGFSVKYCFQYTSLDTASSATNWATHTTQMLGYGTGFTAGSTLPATTTGGITLTWYSDIGLTTQITTSASETDTYYCVMS